MRARVFLATGEKDLFLNIVVIFHLLLLQMPNLKDEENIHNNSDECGNLGEQRTSIHLY